MNRPPVLFLDEPTTGLDITSRNELWEMIRELVSDGTTVLLTTQYLEEADILAKRIAVIDQGRVIAKGTPSALKAQLGSTVFEMDMPAGSGERAVSLLAPVVAGRSSARASTLRITSDAGPGALVEIAPDARRRGLDPQSLTVREPSLDDVFLALTGRHAEAVDAEAVRARRCRMSAVTVEATTRAGARPAHPAQPRPRHVGDREAQPAGLPARAAAARLLHDPARDLRHHVPVRLRRRDRPGQRRRRTSTS